VTELQEKRTETTITNNTFRWFISGTSGDIVAAYYCVSSKKKWELFFSWCAIVQGENSKDFVDGVFFGQGSEICICTYFTPHNRVEINITM
jgi:hypothetical protein